MPILRLGAISHSVRERVRGSRPVLCRDWTRLVDVSPAFFLSRAVSGVRNGHLSRSKLAVGLAETVGLNREIEVIERTD